MDKLKTMVIEPEKNCIKGKGFSKDIKFVVNCLFEY